MVSRKGSLLSSGDFAYARKLSEKYRTTDFFLLELGGEETGDNVIKEIDAMFDISNNVFELESGEELRYAQKASKGKFTGCVTFTLLNRGKGGWWKDIGIMKTDIGAPDRCEFCALVQDDAFGNMSYLTHPDATESHRSTFSSFLRYAHSIVTRILSILDTGLGLQRGTLASLVSQDRTSGILLRLTHHAPQPLNDRRTAITFLGSIWGELKILTPGGDPADEAAWRYIRPAPNRAIINNGDSLVAWSGGILRSNMHRVTSAPGAQADYTRCSIAYLVRGKRNVSMRRLANQFSRIFISRS